MWGDAFEAVLRTINWISWCLICGYFVSAVLWSCLIAKWFSDPVYLVLQSLNTLAVLVPLACIAIMHIQDYRKFLNLTVDSQSLIESKNKQSQKIQ